jgi:hypothetical protein
MGEPADGSDMTHTHNRYEESTKGEHNGDRGKLKGRLMPISSHSAYFPDV